MSKKIKHSVLRIKNSEGEYDSLTALRGQNSYELAVKAGFTGSEEEWMNSIIGNGWVGAYQTLEAEQTNIKNKQTEIENQQELIVDKQTEIENKQTELESDIGEITPASIGAAALDDNGKVTAEQISAGIVNIGMDTALTLSADHCGKCIIVETGTTVTLPTDSSNTIFPIGTEIELFMNTVSTDGAFTIEIEDTETVGFATSNGRLTSITSSECYAVIVLKKITTATWIAKGDIA